MKEIIGIYHHMEQISPEAFKAQRQAELEQMAKYRALKLQKYKDWADPVKREEIKAAYRKDEEECRKLLINIPAELVAVRKQEKLYTMTPVFKETSRKTLWQKIKDWLRDICP